MLTTAIHSDSKVRNNSSGLPNARFKTLAQLAALFLITLAANLGYHFTSSQPNAVFAPDGPHYLATCQGLTKFLLSVIHGKPDYPYLLSLQFAQELALDGPIVPGIPALVFAALGHLPKATGWRIFVVIYSAIASLTSCMVSVLTYQLTKSKAAGVGAFVAFGLLPTTMIATGRYCSEVPAALLLVLMLAVMWRAPQSATRAGMAAVLAGLLVMGKPVYLPTAALLFVRTIADSRRKFFLALLLTVFFAFSIAPWAVYTKASLGKLCITANREPIYNSALGTDLEADGWFTIPSTGWVNLMFTSDSPAAIIVGRWSAEPWGMLKLVLRRCTRLFTEPWNAFRHDVFGISPSTQRLIYLLVIAAGIFGIAVYLLQGRSRLSPPQQLLGDLTFISLASHLGYVLFQGMGRYAFPAVPLFAVFAGYGLFTASDNKIAARSLAGAALITVSLMSALLLADPITRLQDSQEVAYRLSKGDTAIKTIRIIPTSYLSPPTQALVLVDGDKYLDTAVLSVNGNRLADSLLPIASFSTSIYQNYPTIVEHSEFMDIPVEDLHQWRAVAVPVEWLKLDGSNQITVTASENTTLYSDSDATTRKMLSPLYFAHEQMMNSVSNMEPRIWDPVETSRIEQTSRLASSAGKAHYLNGSLRVKLALICGSSSRTNDMNKPAIFDTNINPAAFSSMLRDGDTIKINRYLAKFAPYSGAFIRLPNLPDSSHLHITVSGLYRTDKPGTCLGLPVSVITKTGKDVVLGRCPHALKGTTDWNSFTIEDTIPSLAIPGDPAKIGIYLFPYHWRQAWYGVREDAGESQVKELKLRVEAVNLPDLSSGRVFYY